jgi:putative MATE family efflux protein
MDKVSPKEINRLAFPAMMAGIAEPLIGLADTAIIGHIADFSKEALAAVGLATGFFMFLYWTFVQVETALSAIVARTVGSGKLGDLQSLVSQGVVLNILIGLFLFAISFFFAGNIFDLFQAKGLVKDYAVEYYRIRALGFPVILVTMSFWGVFRGMQNTSWAMIISIAGGAVNLILNLLVVYGVEGYIAPLGVVGAAWGSFCAQCFMLILTLIFLFRKTPFRLNVWWPLSPHLKSLLSMSGMFILRTTALNGVLLTANGYATACGPKFMAAHTIAIQMWTFAAFILDGYANAGLALAGKLIGEQRIGALRHLTKRLLWIGVVVAGVIMLVYTGGYNLLGSIFTNDVEVRQVLRSVFWVVILCQPLSSVAFTLDGVLKGLGEAKYLMIMMVVGLLAFLAMLGIAHQLEMGFLGVWIAMMIWMNVRSIWPWRFFVTKYNTELQSTSLGKN